MPVFLNNGKLRFAHPKEVTKSIKLEKVLNGVKIQRPQPKPLAHSWPSKNVSIFIAGTVSEVLDTPETQ